MKSGNLIFAMALLVALAVPVSLAAQEHPEAHPYYKFVDLGALGGPQSSFNGLAVIINNKGVATGQADTTTKDPNYPNQNPFIGPPDPFIEHPFRWKGRFPLVDMGAFPGTNSSVVNWLNDNGVAVGLSENGTIDPLTGWPAATAALWTPGHPPESLETLSGGNESYATLVNNAGLVAGTSANGTSDPYSMFGYGTQTRAVTWKNGMIKDLGTLGGPDAVPFDINDAGQIAGFSYTNDSPNPVTTPCGKNIPTVDPFFWDGTKMINLGTFGGTCGIPNALNNKGQVVGQSDYKNENIFHPFFWTSPGPMQDLGTLGGSYGSATWINDASEVVGYAALHDQFNHAFLWKPGQKKVKDLGILKGDRCDAAWAINSKTQVIGDSGDCFTQSRPFLWESGAIYDLSTAFPSNYSQWSEAVFINDHGEIAGNVILQNGDMHAYLLIPCKAGTKGCKRVTAGTAAHSAVVTQNPTAMRQSGQSISDGMAAIRARLNRRCPFSRLFGTDQPK